MLYSFVKTFQDAGQLKLFHQNSDYVVNKVFNLFKVNLKTVVCLETAHPENTTLTRSRANNRKGQKGLQKFFIKAWPTYLLTKRPFVTEITNYIFW